GIEGVDAIGEAVSNQLALNHACPAADAQRTRKTPAAEPAPEPLQRPESRAAADEIVDVVAHLGDGHPWHVLPFDGFTIPEVGQVGHRQQCYGGAGYPTSPGAEGRWQC